MKTINDVYYEYLKKYVIENNWESNGGSSFFKKGRQINIEFLEISGYDKYGKIMFQCKLKDAADNKLVIYFIEH